MPDALARIDRNVKQQQRVISDLLDVSRIMTGKLEIVLAPVNLSKLVHIAVEECRAFAEHEMVNVALEPSTNGVYVNGDEQRLGQVFSNLLGNAIKFTAQGGSVSVSVTHDIASVCVAVRDSGIGMTREELDNVFERFWQAERGSTRVEGGLGLGLTIAKHIVKQHSGSLEAASDGPNQGSTFTVKLPLLRLDEREESASAEPARFSQRLGGVRVLVVEDDRDGREALCMILKQTGATILEAVSVEDALELHASQQAQIVITDIGMPHQDGYALAKKIREFDARQGKSTPLIAVTGFVGASDREHIRRAGFDAHLAKPVDFRLLLEQIVALLSDGDQSLSGRRP